MEYTNLGRSGLRVSRLCLGTANFGSTTEKTDALTMMDGALDEGINFFDTANIYGGPVPGLTESIIGEWFAMGGGRREKTVLATKVYSDMGEWPNDGKLSALNIHRALDANLKRLKTDYVELYQFHHVDRATPWDEIWQAMEVAVQQGKVLYAGSSNFAGWHIAKAQHAAEKRKYMGLVAEQSIYNLLERTVELEVLPACIDYGLGVLPWSPLHGGLLGGIIRKSYDGNRRLEGNAAATLAAKLPQIKEYEDWCAQFGHEPGDVALAWLLHQPGVTAPIIGPRTADQLHAALRAFELKLDGPTLRRLDEIFPGHKSAPEDYAW